MELGTRIRSLRTEKNLTQEALASQLEVSRQAIAKWENGQSRPSTANLLALCGVFGVSLDELVSGGAVPEPDKPREKRGKLILSVLSLLSLAFSAAITIFAKAHTPPAIIGGADGPTAIFVTGYIPGAPAYLYWLWGGTIVLMIVTAAVFFRGRGRR